MTKDQRARSMGAVLNAAENLKDDKLLADKVREIAKHLRAEEAEHKRQAASQDAEQAARKAVGA
jgi:demethoxyubiquinone hydroxylase (CLK1/Coq7/Cat5 family)